jgi:hypothetical protein
MTTEQTELAVTLGFRPRQSILVRWMSERPVWGLAFLILVILSIGIYYWVTGAPLDVGFSN